MPPDNITNAATPRNKTLRGILWIGASLVLLLFLAAGLVFFLVPYTVSAPWFREMVESYASRTLNANVSVESMAFGWEKGLRVASIQVLEDPLAPGTPLGTIEHLEIQVDFPALIQDRRLACTILLDAPTLRVIREKDGETNLQRFFAGIAPSGKAKPPDANEKKDGLKPPLADIGLQCRIRRLNILYDDRIHHRTAELQDAAVTLHLPSLFHQPLEMTAAAGIRSSDVSLPPLDVSLKIRRLFDESGALQFHRMAIESKISAPGLVVSVQGDLSQNQASVHGQAALATLFPVFSSLMPDTPLPPIRAGRFEVDGKMTRLDNTRAAFDTALRLESLQLKESPGGKTAPGPITAAFRQKGTAHLPAGDFFIESGAFSFNGGRGEWAGHLQGLFGPKPQVALFLESLELHIPELLATAAVFLPAPLPFNVSAASSSGIQMKKVSVSGHPVQGSLSIQIHHLSGALDGFRVFSEADTLFAAADGWRLSFPRVKCDLFDFAPAALFAAGDTAVTRLTLYPKKEMHIDSVRVSGFQLAAKALRMKKEAPLGFIWPFSVSTALSATGIRALDLTPAELDLTDLQIQGDLGSATFATASVNTLRFHLPAFKWHDRAVGNVHADLSVTASAPHIRLWNWNPLQGDIKGFKAQLSAGKGIDARLEADALDLGRQRIHADAVMTADLEHLDSLFPDLFQNRPPLFGKIRIRCRLSGRVPSFPGGRPPALTALFNPESSWLDAANITVGLSKISGAWPVAGGTRVTVHNLTTPKPLAYHFDGKAATGKLTGEIQIHATPPFRLPVEIDAAKTPPVSARLAVSGTHRRLAAASFSSKLVLYPVEAKAEAAFSAEGFDALFRSAGPRNLRAWLQAITGTAKMTAALPKGTRMALNSKTRLTGSLNVGTELEKAPDQGIQIRVWTDISEMDISKDQSFRIQNLETDFTFEKRYRLTKESPGETAAVRLSDTVIRDAPAPESESSASDTLSAWDARVRARLNPTPSFVFGPAEFHRSPHVVPVRHAALALSLVEGLPRLRHLDIRLLGGSLVGDAGVFRKNDDLVFDAQLIFSDMDLTQMVGAQDTTPGGAVSKIAGQLEITFPLVSSPKRLIENLQARLQLHHIGSRAFERFLYFMDPYESNETIVSQRRLLRSGSPRWIDIAVRDGILSLNGEVGVKGVPIQIPPLERLNLAALSGLDAYEEDLAVLGTLGRILRLASDSDILADWLHKESTKR